MVSWKISRGSSENSDRVIRGSLVHPMPRIGATEEYGDEENETESWRGIQSTRYNLSKSGSVQATSP
jgi:hypothetical protein